MALFLLYESSAGFALFEHVRSTGIAPNADDFTTDFTKFGMVVKLKAFSPFESAEEALENINSISDGDPTQSLLHFLQQNLPSVTSSDKDKKKEKEKDKEKSKDKDKSVVQLGVMESKLGSALQQLLSLKVINDDKTLELFRGIRYHLTRFIKELKGGDLFQSQLGLSHSYSRSKVKFNIHRVDNMIIQSSALLDQLDKDLNTFGMRVREWYSYHFPELLHIISDHYSYAKCAQVIQHKSCLLNVSTSAAIVEKLSEALDGDDEKANLILEAAKMSMGQDISPIDLVNIENFASRVVRLSEFRKNLFRYLTDKMSQCAPNLSALIGEQVGARLISHAGSLTNLAKYPASTVQILGAEKALFRALKTKGNTPKYGLIFHSTFIGRASQKNKGRISRYLANKCSLAARIDCFSDTPTNIFGVKLRQQVEERLEFYKTGKAPRKNTIVMKEAMKEVGVEAQVNGEDDVEMKSDKEESQSNGKKDKKDKKRKLEDVEGEKKEKKKEESDVEVTAKKVKKEKKEKKKEK